MRETTGGKRPKPKYSTMGEVLGFEEEEMYDMKSEEMQALSDQYLVDFIKATTDGTELPDPEKYNLESDPIF